MRGTAASLWGRSIVCRYYISPGYKCKGGGGIIPPVRPGAAGAEKIGTPLQAQRLIDTLFECDNAEATADGRRTVNIISTEDIDKLF